VPWLVRTDARRQPWSSIRVATLFLQLCVVTSGTPSSARTLRQSRPKLFGSRDVPAVDGNIIVRGLAQVRQSAPRDSTATLASHTPSPMLMTSWPIDPLTVSGALARCVIQAFDQVSSLASVGQDADLMRLVGQVELAYDARSRAYSPRDQARGASSV
jgi:hypothetical protein